MTTKERHDDRIEVELEEQKRRDQPPLEDALDDPKVKKFVEDARALVDRELAAARENRSKMLTAAGVSKTQQKELAAIVRTGDRAQIDAWYERTLGELGLKPALDAAAAQLAEAAQIGSVEDG